MFRSLSVALGSRVIVHYDGRFHVRKVLFVEHDEIVGQARYDVEPVASGATFEEAFENAMKKEKA